jgi:hypothetical protein
MAERLCENVLVVAGWGYSKYGTDDEPNDGPPGLS